MTPAPELFTQQWFNVPAPITLASLRGKLLVLHAFQMLCPGCVKSALPQAQRIAEIFAPDKVAVIGIHTVFEHHAAMTPVAVDVPGEDSPIPQTMAAYGMQGTPTMVLIDRAGNIRRQTLGTEDDLRVGADIALLTAESWNG